MFSLSNPIFFFKDWTSVCDFLTHNNPGENYTTEIRYVELLRQYSVKFDRVPLFGGEDNDAV